MKLALENTFDLTYVITLVHAGTDFKELDAPGMKCVWVAAAEGPGYPDVRDVPFNGATCMWERSGVGENYQVDFWDRSL